MAISLDLEDMRLALHFLKLGPTYPGYLENRQEYTEIL
jgi:hypothetical protein